MINVALKALQPSSSWRHLLDGVLRGEWGADCDSFNVAPNSGEFSNSGLLIMAFQGASQLYLRAV